MSCLLTWNTAGSDRKKDKMRFCGVQHWLIKQERRINICLKLVFVAYDWTVLDLEDNEVIREIIVKQVAIISSVTF